MTKHRLCPKCGSKSTATAPLKHFKGLVRQDSNCSECNLEWTDWYAFVQWKGEQGAMFCGGITRREG